MDNKPISPEEEATEESGETPEKKTDILPHIRTYEHDAARVLEEQEATVTKIALSEQERRERTQNEEEDGVETPASRRKLVLIILIVLVLGASIFVFATMAPERGGIANEEELTSELLFTEAKIHIETDTRSENELEREIRQIVRDGDVRVGTVAEILLTRSEILAEEEVVRRMTSQEFFTHVGTRMPPSLMRTFHTEFMLGVHAFNFNQPFLVFTIQSFDNAFAGMLRWEESMEEDLSFLIVSRASPSSELSTSTATTTFAVSARDILEARSAFVDDVIENRDVRYIPNDDGSMRLMYSFPDRNTLLITTSKETFLEVLERLNRARFTR